MLPPAALRLVDDAFEAFAAGPDAPPGLAWGVVAGGGLVHVRGLGTLRVGEACPPDATSVFRIASMTKSFTAATLLLLRDEGRLALDDPVARHVPEAAAIRGPTRDAPPLTIRHLLAMAGGLPTDDPLGDRLQGLPLPEFGELLRAGATFAWPPGTAYEYSNLGYGILGRVVTAAAAKEYRDVVAERLLRPLGLDSTTFDAADVAPDRLAAGYVRRDGQLVPEPIDGYGALAAMGGLFSSVEDLARWVAGFTDAFPARDDPDDRHPLGRASRREMQQVQRAMPPELTPDDRGWPPALVAGGYGFGLFVVSDLEAGTIVGHGGGYPGYGSTMRWHPATGLGIVALANARYARVSRPGTEALKALVEASAAPARRARPLPATERLRAATERLLARWDDGLADEVFAVNMDLDEPRERRRAACGRARERLGALGPDDAPPTSESPAQLTWWLRGERGRLRVDLLATGEPTPRIQALELTVVPDPPPALAAVAARVAALLAGDLPAWPDDLPVAAAVDRGALERGLRAAALLLGPVAAGSPVAGDGERSVTLELRGERARGELRVELDPAGAVVRASAVAATIRPPVEAP